MSAENEESLVKTLRNLQTNKKNIWERNGNYKKKQKTKKRKGKKKYEDFDPTETPVNPKADLSIQGRKEYEGKIKLENKVIDSRCNRVLQKVKIHQEGLSTAFVSGARRENHKMAFQHFEVTESIWGGSPNVEPVCFGIDSILEDFALLIKQ